MIWIVTWAIYLSTSIIGSVPSNDYTSKTNLPKPAVSSSQTVNDLNRKDSLDAQNQLEELDKYYDTSAETESLLGGTKTVGINEEFGNSTITGVVTDVDLNYTEYNELWSEVPAGYKVIFITIKVTNKSDSENYVSVGDFECYVDNIITDTELVTGSDLNYNANIAPGRTAILGAEYIIPENAESIELEYNPIGESTKRIIIKIL